MSSKAQVGARHVARMRGAFSRSRLVAASPAKPEAKAVDDDATRANVGATGAKRPTNPGTWNRLDAGR